MARKKYSKRRRTHSNAPRMIFKHRLERRLPPSYYYEAKIEDVWELYFQERTEAIRNALISRYKQEAEALARQFYYRRMPAYSLSGQDDLISQAYLGLVDAVEKFDPSYGVEFGYYLRLRVTGSILDGLRKMQDFPRVIAKHRREMKELTQQLEQKLKATPTIEDMCREYGEELRPILQDPLFSSGVFSQLQAEAPEEMDSASVLDTIPDYRSVEASVAETVDAETKILNIFNEVGRPDLRVVIYGYYFMRCTNAQVANAGGYSVSTAVNKHHQALRLLKQKITKEEFKELIGKGEQQ